MYTTTLSDIRDTLYLLMKTKYDPDTEERISGVSDYIYMDALPTTMPTSITDCVMLDFESNINNYDVYGSGVLRVWLLIPSDNSEAKLREINNYFNEVIAEYKLSDNAAKMEFRHRFEYAHYDPNRKLRGFVKELKVKIKE